MLAARGLGLEGDGLLLSVRLLEVGRRVRGGGSSTPLPLQLAPLPLPLEEQLQVGGGEGGAVAVFLEPGGDFGEAEFDAGLEGWTTALKEAEPARF